MQTLVGFWVIRQITAEICRICQTCPATLKIKLNSNFCKFANKIFLKNEIRYNGPNDLREANAARRLRDNAQSIRNINQIISENQNALNTEGINEVTREIIQILVETQLEHEVLGVWVGA